MDFRAVLSALTGSEVSMPASGRWANAGMVRGGCPDLSWRLLDAQHWARPGWPAGSGCSWWRILEGGVLPQYCLSPGQCSHFLRLAERAGCPPPQEIEALLLKQGGEYPSPDPFSRSVCGGAAKDGNRVQFRDSFGFADDPFPTLLAGTVNPFAFYFEDDPAGGCVRFLTELESERLMGLPEGWTAYGAEGERISPASRYKALGNAIALPCAEYIMAGIKEALQNE